MSTFGSPTPSCTIVSSEKVNDDRIIPDTFVVNWGTEISHYYEELQPAGSDDGYGEGYRR